MSIASMHQPEGDVMNKISVHSTRDERWKKLMILGEKTGCHQRADRSFSYHGYQFPVCARCTGVILGYIIAIPFFLLTGYHKKISLTACFVMLVDWTLQEVKIMESSNKRRLMTGIAGGFGIMSVQLAFLSKLGKCKKR